MKALCKSLTGCLGITLFTAALLAAEGDLKWTIPLGPGHENCPAVDGKQAVYVSVGLDDGTAGRFYSISPTGTTNWVRLLPQVNWYPTVLGDGMVVVPAMYGLFAFSPAGELVWQRGFWGYPGNVSVGADGSIYFLVRSSESGVTELWSISRTGQINWHEPLWTGVLESAWAPVVGLDGTLYLVLTSDGLGPRIAAIDPSTGTPKIVRTFSPSSQGEGILTLQGGRLAWGTSVLSRGLDLLQELKPATDNPYLVVRYSAVDDADNLIWPARGQGVVKFRFGSGKMVNANVVWRDSYGIGAVVGNDGSVFTYGTGGVSCFDSAGVEKWKTWLGVSWPEAPQPPVVANDGALYVSFSGRQSQGQERTAYLSAIEIPPSPTRRTWSQPQCDLRRSGRLADPSVDALVDSVQKLADGSAEVIVIGEPDHTYAVEYTEDFSAWTFLGEAASANGCVRFVDTGARGRPGRFYRLVKPQ